MSYRWFLSIGLAVIAGTACHAPQEDNADVVFTLKPEFTASLFEQRDASSGASTFGLWITSMAKYDCANYRIGGTVTLTGNELAFRLDDISTPDTCMGDAAPAEGFLPVGPLADGVYRFRVTRNIPIVNEGTLTVKKGHYELVVPKEQDIVFQNRVLEALPDGYVWGYALTPAEADMPVADQFLTKLKPLTSESALPAGYYSYFTVTGTGQYFFHQSIAPAGEHRPFLRRFTGTTDALKSLLEIYRDDSVHPLQIKCLSTSGEL